MHDPHDSLDGHDTHRAVRLGVPLDPAQTLESAFRQSVDTDPSSVSTGAISMMTAKSPASDGMTARTSPTHLWSESAMGS